MNYLCSKNKICFCGGFFENLNSIINCLKKRLNPIKNNINSIKIKFISNEKLKKKFYELKKEKIDLLKKIKKKIKKKIIIKKNKNSYLDLIFNVDISLQYISFESKKKKFFSEIYKKIEKKNYCEICKKIYCYFPNNNSILGNLLDKFKKKLKFDKIKIIERKKKNKIFEIYFEIYNLKKNIDLKNLKKFFNRSNDNFYMLSLKELNSN